ncbi:MAG: hypothetical protein WAO02_18260 [Verrucomicrobiia bacterium]
MDFVKKHYEKILLTVVLLGLVGALVFLPFMIANDQQRVRDMTSVVLSPKVAPLPALDLTRQTNAFARLQAPYNLDFSATNKLFNPLQWQKRPDGSLIPAKTGLIGPDAAVVAKITPLYLVITLDSVETNAIDSNEVAARYVMSVEHQAAPQPGQRVKRQHYASVGEKIDVFTIRDVKSSPDNPAQVELTLQLADTGEQVTLSRDKPFHRVDGYAADLKYDPEVKKWQSQRLGADLKFNGDDYIIVAIDRDSVILLARSNQKKTTLTYSP